MYLERVVRVLRCGRGPAVPDQDDDGGCLGHGADHAAGADHTEEGEEGLLTAHGGTLPRDHPGQRRVAGYTRAPGEVLEHRRTRTHTHTHSWCHGKQRDLH